MIKYIKVDWPEYQKFEEHNRISECYTVKVYGDDDIQSLMVPEDLYNEVQYPQPYCRIYKDTSLGTVECYDDKAVVNDDEIFWYDKEINKGDKLLVYNHNTKDWKIVTCTTSAEGFPILTDDKDVLFGITDELVGIKNG